MAIRLWFVGCERFATGDLVYMLRGDVVAEVKVENGAWRGARNGCLYGIAGYGV